MGAAASIDAAGSDGNDSVTVDKAKSLLQVDATDNVEARAGRAALFEEWWAKLPKNAKGAVSAEDWNRGLAEARRTIPQLAKNSSVPSAAEIGASASTAQSGEEGARFDLWGSLDSLVMEAAAAKVQAAARGRMGRQRAAKVAEAKRMHADETESKRQSEGDNSGNSVVRKGK